LSKTDRPGKGDDVHGKVLEKRGVGKMGACRIQSVFPFLGEKSPLWATESRKKKTGRKKRPEIFAAAQAVPLPSYFAKKFV